METVNQLDSVRQLESRQLDTIKLETFDSKQHLAGQNKPIQVVLKLNIANENLSSRTNYCKKIFKRLKKKDEDKEGKLTKRCKLDVDCAKTKIVDKSTGKLSTDKEMTRKAIKKSSNESSKMFKKMKRILFDVEEKFVIKPDIELSSCSEDDELDRVRNRPENGVVTNHSVHGVVNVNNNNNNNSSTNPTAPQPFIQDGQPKFKVGLNDEDDNAILNLVYNWLARLTACLEQDNWSELKKLVREQRASDSVDLLTHLNLKLFNHKTNQTKCIDTETKWQVLKSINSVANQTV